VPHPAILALSIEPSSLVGKHRRVKDYDESSAARVDTAISTEGDGATDASTELISHADGGQALVDDASTLSEGAVPEGPGAPETNTINTITLSSRQPVQQRKERNSRLGTAVCDDGTPQSTRRNAVFDSSAQVIRRRKAGSGPRSTVTALCSTVDLMVKVRGSA
jgi:hypothetical protein